MSRGYFDVIERNLADRCRAGAHRRRRLRWLPGAGPRRATTALAYAIPVLVAAGIAVLALSLHRASPDHGSGSPGTLQQAYRELSRLPAPQRNQVIAFVHKLPGYGLTASPACAAARAHHPRFASGPAPASLTRSLGVLRRASGPGDRLSPGDTQGFGAGEIYRDAIRLARVLDGERIYLVPALSYPGFTPACLRAEHAVVAAHAGSLASSLRPVAIGLAGVFLGERKQALGVGVLAVGRNSGWGFGPVTRSQLLAGQAIGFGPSESALRGIVPDGVARVEIFYRRHGRVIAVNAIPSDNVFAFPGVRGAAQGFVRIVWHAASGATIRTVTPGSGFGGGSSSFGWSSASAGAPPAPIVHHRKSRHR